MTYLRSLLFVAAFISGCAPVNMKNADQASTYVSNKEVQRQAPVYGLLKRQGDEYHFQTYSISYNQSEPWVRLSDGEPMWAMLEEEECLRGLAKPEYKCKTENVDLFRIGQVDVGRTAFMTALTLGLQASMPMVTVRFDEATYQRALYEALSHARLKSKKELIYDIGALASELRSTYAEVVAKYVEKIKKTPVQAKVTDYSGLYKGGVQFSKYAHLAPVDFEKVPPVSSDSIEGLKEALLREGQSLKRKWQEAGSIAQLNCTSGLIKTSFNFKMACSSFVEIDRGRPVEVPVSIISNNYDRIFPAHIYMKDQNVEVVIDNGLIKIYNKTSSYLAIKDVSIYYGGKIASLDGVDINISPKAEFTMGELDRFPIDWGILRHYDVTLKSLKKLKVQYGVAVEYRIGNSNNRETLYSSRTYQLSGLVK